jgi:hypothetical protein
MVYNCEDGTEPGGRELIGASRDVCKVARGALTLLILAALAATVFVGCGASGGSPQSSEKQPGSEPANSSGQKAEDTSASGKAAGGKLGHPALGSADAPVLLIEYGDYQ